MISDRIFNLVSQSAHVWSGGFIVLATSLFLMRPFGTLGVLPGFVAWILLAAIKEGEVDPAVETPEEQGSGWEDFAVMAAGGGMGALVAIIYHVTGAAR